MTQVGLGEWYTFDYGNITETPISGGDTVQITMPLNTNNRDHGTHVWINKSVTSFDTNTNYFTVGTTTPTSSLPDRSIQFDTVLSINITAINGTSYWNAFMDGTRGGCVQACLETYLTFKDTLTLGNDNPIKKIVFKNTLLNMSVSLTSDFEVDDINVEHEDERKIVVNTDYSGYIEVYECEQGALGTNVPGKIYN